jgi:hypothetical protein
MLIYNGLKGIEVQMKNINQAFLLFFFSAFINFLLSTFCFLPSFAQVNPPLRIEFESAKDQQDYMFVPLAQNGAAIFYQSAVLSLDTAQWVFLHYDTNLVRMNIYKVKLPNLCQYLAADFSNDKLFLFFQRYAHKKDILKNYLLEWNIATQNFQLFELQNYKYQYLSSVKVIDDYLFVIVDEPKMKSIIYYNYKTNVHSVVQFVEDEISSIESFCIDTTSKKTYFSMFLKNKKGSWAELFITDYSGKIKEQFVLPVHAEIVYNSAKLALVGKDSILITGGYTHIKDKKSRGCYSGIYIVPFFGNRFSDLNTYPFGALLARDSAATMTLLSDHNVAMSGHIKHINGHIFSITEFYYPEYQYTTASSYRGYSYYGYDTPSRIFAGFRYLNAYILELNAQGALLNEWYFPVRNVLTQSVYNLIGLHQDNEENTLFYYSYQNEIVSQLMNGKQVLSAQTTIPIELASKPDVLEYSSNVAMRHWYDNNFILSGYQYIKNNQRGKGKRYVFFINKLVCE